MSDIERGRLAFIEKAPYLFQALISLVPHETRIIDTCAVSEGMVLIYNPDYFDRLTDLQVATRLWHEVAHWVRRTHERADTLGVTSFGSGQGYRANIAADLAINSSGLPGGWDFKPDGLLPAQYRFKDGLTFEEYFALLPPIPPIPQGSTWGGRCGGMAGNPFDADYESKVDRELGRSVVDQAVIAKDVAESVRRHEGKHPGTVPGYMMEWADALLAEPVIPWTTVLGTLIMQLAGDIIGGTGDYTYGRMARRAFVSPPGVILPGTFEQELVVEVVLDTSASMDIVTDIGAALTETRGVLQSLGLTEVWFTQIDTNLACETKKIRPDDLAHMQIYGRGGTDFRPAFDAAAKRRPKPALLVYMTDGEGPAPELPPIGIQTVWCLFGEGAPVPATWGKVVRAT